VTAKSIGDRLRQGPSAKPRSRGHSLPEGLGNPRVISYPLRCGPEFKWCWYQCRHESPSSSQAVILLTWLHG